MAREERIIYVFSNWEKDRLPALMGQLTATPIRGKEVFAFEFDPEWLSNHPFLLDPDLYLYGGRQFLRDDKPNFGLFTDSSPDRWGRLLMRRREAAMARKEGRVEQLLFESDYLLGVFDPNRMGALRLRLEPDGPFMNDNQAMAAPPFASLRALEQASLSLEQDNSDASPDYLKWINLLLAPGSSLGGARPKANVIDPDDQLWIAKFPSRFDEKDVAAWEMVLHQLAVQAGITVPEATIRKFDARHHTFLSCRFDRNKSERIHFASAMTLLGYSDGTDHKDGVSYLEMAECIMRLGEEPAMDLEELWRRMVFNICTSNTDDHLRNHGFLLGHKGWRLSPAYDLNPNEMGTGLTLNISENDNALDLDLAMSVAKYFRLSLTRAGEIMDKVQSAVSQWRTVAQNTHISRSEQDRIAPAFRLSTHR